MKYKIVKEYFDSSTIERYIVFSKRSWWPFWSYRGYEFTQKEAEARIERDKIIRARRKNPEVVGYY